MPVTQAEVSAALNSIKAVADTIRELGEVPSGHLYAQLMPVLGLHEYERIIDILKRAGLVRESNNLLTWVEPQ